MPGESILIVDDNTTNLKLMKILLSVEGYNIKTAIDAEDALAVLKSFHPALILMDIQLPGMDGLELTKKIKATKKFTDVIIVAVTAYAMKGDEQKVLAAGCNGYISKPINVKTFPAMVLDFIQMDKALKKNE